MNFSGASPTTVSPARVEAADLTVVGGGGHVGIPLVLAFAEAGLRVNVHDLDRAVLDTLRSGRLPFIERGGEALLQRALARERLLFTSDPSEISPEAPVIITIGTPVDEFLNPVRRVIQECIDALLPHLADGQLLILRSTVFPGTTEWIDGYMRRKGRVLKVAFCPERVVQGKGIQELKDTPQIISANVTIAARASARSIAILPIVIPDAPQGAIRDPCTMDLGLVRVCRLMDPGSRCARPG